jgi:hypothetical protein
MRFKDDVDSYMLTFERSVLALITARFNTKQFHVLPRWCISMFYMNQKKLGTSALCSIN